MDKIIQIACKDSKTYGLGDKGNLYVLERNPETGNIFWKLHVELTTTNKENEMEKVEIFINSEWKFTAGLTEKDIDILFRVAEALSDTAEE